jgi:quercetin dioxygenase-like cupin family protein
MAYKNKIIQNPKTGLDIRFLKTGNETNGLLLEMEAVYHARSQEPVLHYHPAQEEDFTILSGELTVRIHNEMRILRAGDKLHVPRGIKHAMWNNSDGKTRVNWKVSPAKNTEWFLETASGLARDGKLNEKGMPHILQVALMANRFSGIFRLVKPPFVIQKIVFTVLSPIAWISGYRATYKKYID